MCCGFAALDWENEKLWNKHSAVFWIHLWEFVLKWMLDILRAYKKCSKFCSKFQILVEQHHSVSSGFLFLFTYSSLVVFSETFLPNFSVSLLIYTFPTLNNLFITCKLFEKCSGLQIDGQPCLGRKKKTSLSSSLANKNSYARH